MARKRIKKQTLNEFQSWLQGIIEIQPDGWTPDAAQWKMIYDKIINIKETPVVTEAPQPAQQQPVQPYIPPAPVPQPPAFNPADVEMTPAAKKALATGTPDNPAMTATPNVDDDGNISSSFA